MNISLQEIRRILFKREFSNDTFKLYTYLLENCSVSATELGYTKRWILFRSKKFYQENKISPNKVRRSLIKLEKYGFINLYTFEITLWRKIRLNFVTINDMNADKLAKNCKFLKEKEKKQPESDLLEVFRDDSRYNTSAVEKKGDF